MTTPFTPFRTPTIVTPTQYGTWRQDVHNTILAMLATFQAASATQGYILQVFHALPDSITASLPFVYIADFTETITHDGQTRTTLFEGSIAYVDLMTDREQVDDRINAFFDLMRDLFTYNYNILPPGIFAEVDADRGPKEIRQGLIVDAHAELRWTFSVQEGYR
jgi:hypothetical protein